jgi:hypothetical protein
MAVDEFGGKSMRDGTVWGMIDAQPIVFPAPVHDANSALMEFAVDAGAARSLLTGDAFELVESPEGTARLLLGANEYRRGAWGPCNVLEVMLRSRPVGAPPDTDGVYLCDAPVSHPFIREAAHRSLRSSRRLESIEVELTEGEVTYTVSTGSSEPDMVLRLPRVPPASPGADPVRITTDAYSHLDDEPYVIPFEIDLPTGHVDPADVRIELGDGWFADMLRHFGLPKRPEWCSWGEGLTALFHMAVPLAEAAEAAEAAAAASAGPVQEAAVPEPAADEPAPSA